MEIKIFIKKRFPAIFNFLKEIYLKISDFKIQIGKTKKFENYWRSRPASDYWDVKNHPSRPALLSQLEIEKHNSFFEFGCNCGMNLFLIQQKNTKAKLAGMDICSAAIIQGQKILQNLKIQNIQLIVGEIEDLKKIPDNEYDVVLTCATLIEIGPDKIEKTLKNLFRIAKKRLVFLEHHLPNFSKKGKIKEGHYVRDFELLTKKVLQKEKFNLEIKKIAKELWGDNWARYGNFIILNKKNV